MNDRISNDQATADGLVAEYLSALRERIAGLPPAVQADLLAQVSDHIGEARAGLAADDVVAVREMLYRLGEPDQIAAAAGAGPPVPTRRTPGERAYDWATILLLVLGDFIVPLVGWAVGVVMLWRGPRWTLLDRIIGTLVWPLGPIGPPILGAVLGLNGAGRVSHCVPVDGHGMSCDPPPSLWQWLLGPDPFAYVPLAGAAAIVGGYLAVRAARTRTVRQRTA
jgi:hypothetical protein